MVRFISAISLALWFGIGGAQAQPVFCLPQSQAWSWTYSGDPITAIIYYLDSEVLSVSYASGIMHLMDGVSINTATRFQRIGYGVSPDPIWAAVRYSYKEILQAQNHCPLLAQNGRYLLAAPTVDTPH